MPSREKANGEAAAAALPNGEASPVISSGSAAAERPFCALLSPTITSEDLPTFYVSDRVLCREIAA